MIEPPWAVLLPVLNFQIREIGLPFFSFPKGDFEEKLSRLRLFPFFTLRSEERARAGAHSARAEHKVKTDSLEYSLAYRHISYSIPSYKLFRP